MKKWIVILGIVVVLVLSTLFISTGGARTDVFLHKFEVLEDGKIMTINVGVTSSAGYIRKMKQTDNYMDPNFINLTFYSTFGINSKLGAKDIFQLELDENIDEIYFDKGDRGYVKVLEKDKETGEWQRVRENQNESNEYSEAEKYYDYFLENNQIVTLLDEGITDDSMAAYAVFSLKNRDFQNGNSKEEYDDITEKYFGRKIKEFNNSKTYIDSNTKLIKPTGWSFDSSVFMVLKNLNKEENGTITADFYLFNISDVAIYDIQKTLDEIKKDLLNNKFDEYSKNPPIIRINFEEKIDENGEMYIKYLSINNIEE